ncbi:cell division topological specificity factor MinE [Taylorella equigenitalis]|uniref:Cell division topological specificity factor n=3 Tax=Taylorella equigenitalis TaxID=29575 RepID=A0A654KFT6_TAYEM|nr:cell division topological specificity factor MinE [Taylorella equigenitalis]ADU91281.1 Cell division topological specificity factor MinE [Taylorella equigenitalis MCE9]AFN36378.1 cell division topological specificity factor [Taylorella equigenitalis ATCC 35865]ASY30947.1 cell division topological specificity factor MinE [Taylorella equigenitalis]ASY38251.1 cell division topological specificity factor MinE [Taylorella equigenitalis]ASY39780.1 cell division topological specificity factor MinE
MALFDYFFGQKKRSTDIGRERLKLILVRDREATGGTEAKADFLPQLQKELIEVISKYIKVNPEDIKVSLDRQDSLEVLEVKIEMDPDSLNK